MTLLQLECPIDEKAAENLTSFLEEDALSITWYENEPNQWVLNILINPEEESSFRHKMIDFFKNSGFTPPKVTAKTLTEEDWVAAVYKEFPPLIIGRFYIYGSHNEFNPPKNLIHLHINAATAFGSGQHESTEGCLKALTLLADQQSFQSPLDMGCGSGILALAMASLWEVPVLACDNDPEAVRVTCENAHLNKLAQFIEGQQSEGFANLRNKTFDIITANILAGPLCHMAPDASKALKSGGYIVLAGLLNRQSEDVIDAYRSVGIKLVDQLFIGDWSTLVMRREEPSMAML
jgi:ribosomal protein L11 methyltransferase